jgi:hypothetical protein
MGGTGCTDAGKLVRFDNGLTNQPTIVGTTYTDNLSALAFDPIGRRLIVGKRNGQIGILNKETGMGQGWIVLHLLPDPSPPAELSNINLYPNYLHALDYDPTGKLYAVLSTYYGTEFLVSLDLDAADLDGNLEVDVIGIIGSADNGAFSDAPFGFQEVYGIAFNPMSGELFGVGKKLPIGETPSIYLIKINTQYVPIPDFATEVGPVASGIISGARAMAATQGGEFIVSANGTGIKHVLVSFSISGYNSIQCEITSLDGQITGLAYITEFEPSGRPPKINSFNPYGGNTGIIVTINGEGFTRVGESGLPETNVSAVYFNDVPVLGDIVVVSDNMLRVTVPDAGTGPIKVVSLTDSDGDGNLDETISQYRFKRTNLNVIMSEINQGIPSYPCVAGKNTLVRLMTSSSEANLPVKFGTASLSITKPDGLSVDIPATFYTQIFTNGPDNIEITQRHNINFYVSGDDLEDQGNYLLNFEIRAFSIDPEHQPGQIIYQASENREFVSPPGNFRVLYLYGCDGADDLWPNEIATESISRVFQEASRVLPVRNGISRLGDDNSAGVQIEFIGGIQFESHPGDCGNYYPPLLFDDWKGAMENVLEKYNEDNCDYKTAEYVVGFIRSECVRPDMDDPRGYVPWGASEMDKPYSVSIVYSGADLTSGQHFALYCPYSKTAIHEFGHNMGRVGEQSPNYMETEDEEKKNHSKNDMFPPGADIREIRAFNVPGHYSLENLPRSVMHGRASGTGDCALDGTFFFEDFEYNKLLNASHRFGTMPDLCPIIGCSPPFCSDIYMVARIEEDNIGNMTAEILQSYIIHEKPYTPLDPNSPYALVFLDESSQILSRDPFQVSFNLRTDNGSSAGNYRSTLVSLTRPIPEGTKAVQIRYLDQILVTLNKSNGQPTISDISSPSEDQHIGPDEVINIEWEASDPDGDQLHFNVSYSPNPDDEPENVRWFPIAIGITDTKVQWMTGGSPGTEGGRIRIMASDGFYPVIKQSDCFTVAEKPPMVSILQPKEGQVFLQYDPIVLEAMAFDLENGMLDGAKLQWNSAYGTLATGREVLLEPGIVSPAPNQSITLRVTDGASTVTKTVNITVLEDIDRDGLSNDFENQYDSQNPEDPYDAGKDVDEDGLTSLQENTFGTNPERADTDGDGYNDSDELSDGSNPNDPESMPEDINRYHFALSSHLGWGIPLNNFKNLVDPGFLVELDLEYRLSHRFALDGVLGCYNFDPDFRIVGGTLYLRSYQQLPGPTEIYEEAGMGIYDPNTLNKALGVSNGLGVSRVLIHGIRGEIGANYFHLFNEGDDIDFIGFKMGLRFTF